MAVDTYQRINLKVSFLHSEINFLGVNQDIVNQKILEIEVCVTQRYTRKSYIIATWNIPVSMATRKLRKERYPLRPCISTSLPANMRVYNGSDMSKAGVGSGIVHSQSASSLNKDDWATPYSPNEVKNMGLFD